MINLRNSPLLWLALWLLCDYGLAGSNFIGQIQYLSTFLWIVCLFGAGFGIYKYKPGKQFYSTVAIALLVFSAGTIRFFQFRNETMPDSVLEVVTRMQGLVEVSEVLKEKETSITLKCKNLKLSPISEESIKSFNDEYVVLYIKAPELKKFLPGDRLLVEGWVSAIQGPMNPHAFDIRTYYRSITIRHQMNCKGAEVFMHQTSNKTLLRMTARWQKGLCEIIRQHTTPQVAQLTNALVWGDRTYMDEDIRDAFADSGAMHVLSVSGMHMAIVYSMLFLLLGAPGSGTFPRRIFRFAIYTMAILLYMGLTGACPAVVRSGLMIILFLLGKAMGWNTQIWNLLGFAAAVMLWINPLVMYNTGFQLSFLAMAGILLYAQPIIRYFSFKYLIIHRIWEVTAVSIAAQVFIFPLLLLQFYQFPLTFILSSLVAMPASYLIIFGALVNTCLAFLEWTWLWEIYDFICRYFLLSMKWMAGLNPEMNYSLPVLSGILLTAMAVLFSMALIYRWPPGKRMAYLLGICALVNLAWHRKEEWRKNEITIYHQYQGMLIDVMADGHCYSIRDSMVTNRSIEFAARGNRCFKDVISTKSISKTEGLSISTLHYDPSLLVFGKYKMIIWNGVPPEEAQMTGMSHVFIDQSKKINDLMEILCIHPDVLVILPAHLKSYGRNTLLKFLKENNIQYHDIAAQGHLTIEI